MKQNTKRTNIEDFSEDNAEEEFEKLFTEIFKLTPEVRQKLQSYA